MRDNKRGGKQLCYLEASKVEASGGDLAGLTVQTHADETLGTLDGVLIDPTERRLCYFVVETRGLLRRKRYLLSADVPMRVEPERQRLQVDAADADVMLSDEFDVRTVRPFSSEDAIDAMFSRDITDSAPSRVPSAA